MHQPKTKNWQIAPPIPPNVESLLSDYPSILQQFLFNRGIDSPEAATIYLTQTGPLHDPFQLKSMHIAVDRLWMAIDEGEQIVVYGDYDVDGVTATALLVKALRKFGGSVKQYIPNRFDEGYGLNKIAIAELADQGIRLIVTVDCGIRSPKEIEYARSLDMDVIISDHHEPRGSLPQAVAVINPKQSDDAYPEKNLAGVGLAYKITEAMLAKRPSDTIDAKEWLDLVAIGTVADIVPLVGENRTLVRAGLERVRSRANQGLTSLAGVAGVPVERISATNIAFALGPRINAAGRLESAELAYELLMAEDPFSSACLAQKLDDQNRRRQEQTSEIMTCADEIAQVRPEDNLLIAAHTNFSMGLVGLAAARLTENYYRPSIVGNQGEEFTRASCRSIKEFHITQALDECSDLLERYGGHAMAAGFTIRNENLQVLTERLKSIADQQLEGKELHPTLYADMEIPLKMLHPRILDYLDLLEPVGMNNPGALFVSRDLAVKKARTVGSDNSHLKLTVTDGWITYDAIAFRQGYWAADMPKKIDLLYAFERNIFNGRQSLQLNVRDLKPAST
jgi:single-stranded-DNA-specific exonuclease